MEMQMCFQPKMQRIPSASLPTPRISTMSPLHQAGGLGYLAGLSVLEVVFLQRDCALGSFLQAAAHWSI